MVLVKCNTRDVRPPKLSSLRHFLAPAGGKLAVRQAASATDRKRREPYHVAPNTD